LFNDRDLNIIEARIYLKPQKGLLVNVPAAMHINGANPVEWNPGDDIALPGATGEKDKLKGGIVSLGGTPVRKWTVEAGAADLDKGALDDILILVKYGIS
jgi:hypothetical protein